MVVTAGADFANREGYVVRIAVVVGILRKLAIGDSEARMVERDRKSVV